MLKHDAISSTPQRTVPHFSFAEHVNIKGVRAVIFSIDLNLTNGSENYLKVAIGRIQKKPRANAEAFNLVASADLLQWLAIF